VRTPARELLKDRSLSLGPRNYHGPDREELEAGLRSEVQPAITGRRRVRCGVVALERGPDVAEVAQRGTDRSGVAFDDNHAEATGAGLNGVCEADDARADDNEISGQGR
jgi:hypothetical protein